MIKNVKFVFYVGNECFNEVYFATPLNEKVDIAIFNYRCEVKLFSYSKTDKGLRTKAVSNGVVEKKYYVMKKPYIKIKGKRIYITKEHNYSAKEEWIL